ncbi:hypothetical protein [Streptomyces sp. VRA16 Mangrove soil]|uniref:hypothetical protein n=1 Tax=Streptomyces sp. VRA16 Mangrove soil TaxID=2817434 RepID=UPI001A9F6D2C|nr:hypothetical protein [Streptomyces sp. VRA16 Mangrove soil]MBO1334405.1 hypothetical protein [Streptomyces sp. VRA16 Mangrove soil]
MITSLVVAALLLHGLVHLPVWLAPSGAGSFDPRRSWALHAAGLPQARAGAAAVLLACTTAALYGIAGSAVLAGLTDWATAAVGAALIGVVLKTFWFNRWLVVGLLLDVGVLVAVATGWPGSLY